MIDVEITGTYPTGATTGPRKKTWRRLFVQTIPKQTKEWKTHRVMLYIHGGLNDEKDAAKRIVAYRDVCLTNEMYPLHIMWESDWFNTVRNIIEDQFTAADERAGGTFLDHLREARDRVLELTLAYPGGQLWGEMKENARLASERKTGAMQLLGFPVLLAQALGLFAYAIIHFLAIAPIAYFAYLVTSVPVDAILNSGSDIEIGSGVETVCIKALVVQSETAIRNWAVALPAFAVSLFLKIWPLLKR